MNIAHPSFMASAPATLMLAGEHAVLHGHPALVCAVNQRIAVKISPRRDNCFTINSAIGDLASSLENVTITAPFQFVTATISLYVSQLPCGFDLQIDSEFSHTVGLGSSAAVTVATIAVFSQWLELSLSLEDIYQQAYKVILQVQQLGSGADVAASVFGGIGFYQNSPFDYKKLSTTLPLSAVYSGRKEPTIKVIAEVNELINQVPEQCHTWFNKIAQCTKSLRIAIEREDWAEVGILFNQHFELQHVLGVSNELLTYLIHELRETPNILGAKISGAGRGDCIIGVGQLPANTFPRNEAQQHLGIQQLDLEISHTGVCHE